MRRVEPAAFTRTSALGVDEQRVNVLLDLDGAADSWRSLGDGFAVEVEVTVWSKPDATQLPTSCLFRTGDRGAVFVVSEGRARVRMVEPGRRGPIAAEILDGVAPGDVVVAHPGAGVRDGVRVEFR